MKNRKASVANERGQVTTALAVVFAIFFLAFGFMYLAPLSKAGIQANELQIAADAAALAGAQKIVSEMPEEIIDSIKDDEPLDGGLGSSAAEEFANRNNAQLVSYHYSPSLDTIDVKVRSNSLIGGEHRYAVASAKVDLYINLCKTPDGKAFGEDEDEDEDDHHKDKDEDKPKEIIMDCGDLSVKIKVIEDEPILADTPKSIKDKFTPALSG